MGSHDVEPKSTDEQVVVVDPVEIPDPDIYHKLTGSFGRWQANATAFYFVAYILTTFNNLGYVFQSANTDHRCIDPIIDLGNSSSCDVKCEQRIYNNSIGFQETIISKYDLVCGDEWLRSFSQSMYQMGYVVSGVIISIISDRHGRKLALKVSIAFELLGGLLVMWSGSVYLYILSRFILGFGDSGRGMCLYMLVIESVGKSRRADVIMACNFGWVIGYLLLPLVAFLLRNYVYVQMVPTATMALMAFIWLPFVTESPRWLLATGKFTEAEQVLRKACKSNGCNTENFATTFELVKIKASKLVTSETESRVEEKSKSKNNFWHLIIDRRFRYITLILWFSFFANGFIYHGFSLNIEIIGGNTFVNFALAGLIEIPSVVLGMVGLKLMGRRTFITGAILSAALSYATVASLRIWYQLPDDNPWLIALTMLGKMFIFASFNSIYIHAGEIFPTQFRQSGVSSCSISARFGSTIAPFIKDLTMSVGLTNTIILFCSLSLAAAIGTLFLPETKNRDLIDTIH